MKNLLLLLCFAAAAPAAAVDSNTADGVKAAAGGVPHPHVAIRVRQDNSTISLLPLSANEAASQFGTVPPKRIQEVSALYARVLDAIRNPAKKVDLPPLYISLTKPPQMDYRMTDAAELNQRLNGADVVAFDPINLAPNGSETYEAVVVRLKQPTETSPEFFVITFAYQNEKVIRLVFSFQPWITTAQVNRGGDLYG